MRAYDAAGNTSDASSPLTVTTSATGGGGGGIGLDDFDGNPAYPSAAKNDLAKWTGGNCFSNGGGNGVVTGGALTLQYNNCGWFGSDVGTDVSAYTYLVVRIKGATGGEQSHFNLSLGGATKVFGDYTLDGGGHPALTTTYQDIKIPLAANGINRASPAQLAMGFWYGSNSSITIDTSPSPTDDPGRGPAHVTGPRPARSVQHRRDSRVHDLDFLREPSRVETRFAIVDLHRVQAVSRPVHPQRARLVLPPGQEAVDE
ncbi:hypothetical protein AB0H83_47960 [Dactylosporangium sp. NPDC050688]|uniref:hypothetical protein n=1 Tax=Dactylosporangium sp. NPDC050688 TaxID=3157217 RepID=UPI0033D05DDD